jgi:gluconate 2-dehydrogenase gamma chain
MNRREALQRAGLVLGYAVSAPVLAGIMNGCKAQPELPFKPIFLNDNQARLVSELAEIIIPKTDTPGAKDAGVPGFIDKVLSECYKKKDQERYLDGLKAFEEEAKKTMGDSFLDLNPAKQVEFATKMNAEGVALAKSLEDIKRRLVDKTYADEFITVVQKDFGAPEIKLTPDSLQMSAYFKAGDFNMTVDKKTNKIKEVFRTVDGRQFFMTTKELTVSGFFTSEPGATQVLQYEAVPGAFHGCLPLAEVGKTWATS